MRAVTVFALFCLVLMPFSPSWSAGTEEQSKAVEKTTFLVIYRPGPAWLPGKPLSQQPLTEHGKYMLSLHVNGSMKFAGPLMDDAGGAVVLQVVDEAEAKAIVAADPAVRDGIFVHEIHPWGLVQWEKYLKK